jgi:hypothetical protein
VEGGQLFAMYVPAARTFGTARARLVGRLGGIQGASQRPWSVRNRLFTVTQDIHGKLGGMPMCEVCGQPLEPRPRQPLALADPARDDSDAFLTAGPVTEDEVHRHRVAATELRQRLLAAFR